MVFSMFETAAAIELRFFCKGDVWSVIISILFSGSWNIFHPTEILLYTFHLEKIPFYHGTYTYKEYQ